MGTQVNLTSILSQSHTLFQIKNTNKMANGGDPNSVGKAFIGHYYGAFDSNRASLSGLFNEKSMMTYEGSQHAGNKSIMEKLTTLKFEKVKHERRQWMSNHLEQVGSLLL